MKTFISSLVLSLMFAPALANACPNLSGTYVDDKADPGISVSLTQANCQNVKIVYTVKSSGQASTANMIVDGQKHILENASDFSAAVVYQWQGNNLVATEQDVWTVDKQTVVQKTIFSLDASKNLQQISSYTVNGKGDVSLSTIYRK